MSSFVRMILVLGIMFVCGWALVSAAEAQWNRGRVAGERLKSVEIEKERARQADEHAALVMSVTLLTNLFNVQPNACARLADGMCVLSDDVWKKHRIQFTQTGIQLGARSFRITKNADGHIIDVAPARSSSSEVVTLMR